VRHAFEELRSEYAVSFRRADGVNRNAFVTSSAQ